MKKILILLLILSASIAQAETVTLLTDIRVAYYYEDPESIDWPLVYYLTQENGCQVDLVIDPVAMRAGPM